MAGAYCAAVGQNRGRPRCRPAKGNTTGLLGTPLKNRRAGETSLAWNLLTRLPTGALSKGAAHDGVRLLRSTVGTGYVGPAPIKGHGPHCYVFQLFALPAPATPDEAAAARTAPRALLAAVHGPALARARLTGTYQR